MRMRLFFCLLSLLWTGLSVQQTWALPTDTLQQPLTFVNPFDFPMTFSGNFGEIRANHFHGGLDFKTGGVTGKPVRALADGHISRIRVTHGSGYVLEVAYDCGYTTINRHLSGFVGKVAQRIEALQYAQESWEVELVPSPDEYPVKAGQVIGMSGNTGYSFGPHLHLDVYETATGEYVDPLPFFAGQVKDHTAPKAVSIMLFPQPGKGVVMGQQADRQFPLKPDRPVTAWGVIGVGIRAYDYMDGVHNKYGVHTAILEVDGVEVFRSVVDRFAYAENRYINSWTKGQHMKSFVEPGNRLRMLHPANDNRGLITIDEERPYHLTYVLRDALGNTSKVRFVIQGKASPIAPRPQPDTKYAFAWEKVNYLQEPGLELVLPRGVLYDDVSLNYAVSLTDSNAVAYTYRLHDRDVPLHKFCNLRIGIRRFPVSDSTKYYLAGVTPKGKTYYVGGTCHNGFVEARIGKLSAYTVCVDTVPPVLTAQNPAQWGRNGRIVFKARDRQTGVASYRGTIDGKYALFGKPNLLKGDIVCRLDPKHVQKGKTHVVEMTVTDACGNRTVKRARFVW